MSAVLDSSVVLAIISGEAGHEKALVLAQKATISLVNLAEVVTKCVEQNLPAEAAIDIVAACDINVLSFNAEQAILAGELRRKAPKGVLSLGDRACIATAILSGRSAVTADKAWMQFDLGCQLS